MTGKIELVNQLDSEENKVEHFANRKLDYTSGSLSFFDTISVDQMELIKNGSFLLKARVVVVNFHIIQSDRYARMLEKRKGKISQNEGVNEKMQVVEQQESHKTKKPSRIRKQTKVIASNSSITLPDVSPASELKPHSLQLPPIWTEVVSSRSVPAFYSHIFYVKIQGVDQEILVKWDYAKLDEPRYWSLLGSLLEKDKERNVLLWVRNVGWEGEVQLVEFNDQKENNFADVPNQMSHLEENAEVIDTSEQFKQDLCQSLNSVAVGEEMLKQGEENKSMEVGQEEEKEEDF